MGKEQKIIGGLVGLAIGDALGVPVEFCPRQFLDRNPVTDYFLGGTHNQPEGTFSDDSSLAFCTAESLIGGLDYKDMGQKFLAWVLDGYWTAHGNVFDIGNTTRQALKRLENGTSPLEAGSTDEYSNGNGSLMRILPVAFYVENASKKEQFEVTHNVSRITHSHKRSQIACALYVQFAINLLKGEKPLDAYQHMQEIGLSFYSGTPYEKELSHFEWVLRANITDIPCDKIQSKGYVVHTLEAGLWSFLTTEDFRECVLRAVNLGEDTDTTGAVAGGIAGIYYGIDEIPPAWVRNLVRGNDIIDLGNRFHNSLYER